MPLAEKYVTQEICAKTSKDISNTLHRIEVQNGKIETTLNHKDLGVIARLKDIQREQESINGDIAHIKENNSSSKLKGRDKATVYASLIIATGGIIGILITAWYTLN